MKPDIGEVPEWSNGAVSKTVVPYGHRGFESLPLRHVFLIKGSKKMIKAQNHRHLPDFGKVFERAFEPVLGLNLPPKIIIIGGGIGGLSAALALAFFGFASEIYEQKPDFSDDGGGIQLSPNAMAILALLGLEDDILKKGCEPLSAIMRDGYNGKILLTMRLKDICQKRYGAKYIHIHRADLIAILKDAVGKANIPIHFKRKVKAYRQNHNEAAIILDDGNLIKGDLVIGADGVDSVVARLMHKLKPASFTKQVAWRGVVPAHLLPQNIISPSANLWLGRGKHFVAYYIRQAKLINFVACEEHPQWMTHDWQKMSDIARLRDGFQDWDLSVRTILAKAEQCFLSGLFERQALLHWSDGRVVLLGDSCHPMLPFMAQGAAMAIEDGFIFAQNLKTHIKTLHHREILSRYEKKRKPRCSHLQKRSRLNGYLFHLSAPAARFCRKCAFKIGHIMPYFLWLYWDKIYRKIYE